MQSRARFYRAWLHPHHAQRRLRPGKFDRLAALPLNGLVRPASVGILGRAGARRSDLAKALSGVAFALGIPRSTLLARAPRGLLRDRPSPPIAFQDRPA